MADETQPSQGKAKKSSSQDKIYIPYENFDLAEMNTMPSTPSIPLSRPRLSGLAERLSKQSLRAELARTDLNHDGMLDATELRLSSDVSEVSRATIKFLNGLLEDQANRDERLNAELLRPKTAKHHAVHHSVTVAASMLATDAVVMDRDIRILQLAETSGLTLDQVDRIMRRALPGGIAEIKLSDECVSRADPLCTPDVPGLIKINLKPEPKI